MAGAFDGGFDAGFDVSQVGTGTTLELVLDLGYDQAQRPDHPLWRRYGYALSGQGLLLYKDGRVQPVTQFDLASVLAADDYLGGGHRIIVDVGSWQADVLAANGYELVLVEDP